MKTGPKSTLGKSVSSKNATRHGLLSVDLILSSESREEFEQLTFQLSDELAPVGLLESTLVEKIAICIWRQRRLVRAESASIELRSAETSSDRKSLIAKALGTHTLQLDAMNKDIPEIQYSDEQILQSIEFWKEGARLQILLDQPDLGLPASYLQKVLKDAKSVDKTAQTYMADLYKGWSGYCDVKLQKLNKHLVANMLATLDALANHSLSIPPQAETLARYQSSLDNEFNKAFRALRDAQAWRREKQLIEAVKVEDAKD